MSPITSLPPDRSGLIARFEAGTPYLLSLFRIVVGLLFFCHGASSVFGWFGGAMGSGKALDAGSWPGWYAAVIQLVTGALAIVGLGTRGAAFLASGSMAYAYFTQHQKHALLPLQNNGEPAVMFCWAFLLLVFTGPGAWALDRFFGTEQPAVAAEPVEEREPTRV